MKRMSFSAEQWMSIHGIEKAIKRLKVSPQGKSACKCDSDEKLRLAIWSSSQGCSYSHQPYTLTQEVTISGSLSFLLIWIRFDQAGFHSSARVVACCFDTTITSDQNQHDWGWARYDRKTDSETSNWQWARANDSEHYNRFLSAKRTSVNNDEQWVSNPSPGTSKPIPCHNIPTVASCWIDFWER